MTVGVRDYARTSCIQRNLCFGDGTTILFELGRLCMDGKFIFVSHGDSSIWLPFNDMTVFIDRDVDRGVFVP